MKDLSNAEQLADGALEAFRHEQFEAALEGFNEARSLFLEQGLAVRAAEMANNAAVALLQIDQPDAARTILEGTPEVFASAGEIRLQAQAYGNQASALEALGERTQAEALFRRALELFHAAGDGESQAYTLQSLSRLQLKDGRPFQALDSMQTALDVKPQRGIARRFLRRLLDFPSRFLNR